MTCMNSVRRLAPSGLTAALFSLGTIPGLAAGLFLVCTNACPAPAEGLGTRPLEFESTLADTTDVVESVSTTTMTLTSNGLILRLPYYANRSLDGSYDDVRRAVVVLNGTLRNAGDYYESVMQAARAAGADQTSIVIAPQYLTEEDIHYHHLPSDYLFWAYMGWRQGDQSLDTVGHPRPWSISSFAVVDTILQRLAAQNPLLDTLVVAGHSAGGQFIQRFAAGSRMEPGLQSAFGVHLRYIVSNPSSYMYMNEERWVHGSHYQFEVPDPSVIAECPDYNHYKYGLEFPNPYMSFGSDQIRAQYAQRDVVYLLGGSDTNPHDWYLETNCEAQLEGSQRLERGTVYHEYLQHYYGPDIIEEHVLAVVPGVGHDQDAMFNSDCGIYYLFDSGWCVAPPASVQWTDVTDQVLAAVNGQAAAWGDSDGDGDIDLFVPSTDDADGLLRNDTGRFSDATPSVLRDPAQGMSAAWGDYDNDGDLDLYEANWRAACKLYRNDGGNLFTDVTAGPLAVEGDACDVSWVDYDNDADVDLFVTRTNGQSNMLLRNDGSGVFADATSGLLANTGDNRDASWGDFDNDGDQDVYLSSASQPNKLLRNDGGTFTDVTASPLGQQGANSSAAWGDYDNDGDLDLYVSKRNDPAKLLRNEGDGTFADVTTMPLGDSGNCRSSTWCDFDNDGYLDLFLVRTSSSNRLLRNLGNGFFFNVTTSPLNEPANGYCAVWGDYDEDGDIDVYVANHAAPNKLFRNDMDPPQHWLQVDLEGRFSNRFGVGARIRIVCGGTQQTREVGSESGYLAQNSLTAEFGLSNWPSVDSLEVHWPSGFRQVWTNLAPDQRLLLIEMDPNSDAPPAALAGAGLRLCAPNPFHVATDILYQLKAPGMVDLTIHDTQGRLVRLLRTGTWASAGWHRDRWDATDDRGRRASPGVYYCRLSVAGRADSRRIVLLP